MSVIHDIPTVCGCITANKAPCNNKIMFIFDFNDINRKKQVSCGVHAHVNSIYAALNIEDHVVVLKKTHNSTNSFNVLYQNASCFDVHIHHKLFFGPLNLKHTAKITAEKYAKEFQKIRTLFRIQL